MNIYKILTFLLGFLLVIAVSYILWLPKEHENNVSLEEENEVSTAQLKMLDFLNADILMVDTIPYSDDPNELRKKLKIHPARTGAMLRNDQARKKMEMFRKINTDPGSNTPIISPYAFAFGRDQILKVVASIDSLNRKMGKVDSEDSIQGVRIYLTWTQKPTKPDSSHLDLLFIPAKGNGRDFFQLEKLIETDSGEVLNTSSPCPDMCN
ncbi:MAG: hypothetical protein ACNS60_20215 [Candidatus Cyclobacteriaceae bacterium M2_1C_046]